MRLSNILGAAAAAVFVHAAGTFLTTDDRYEQMRAELDNFETADANTPHEMDCKIDAKNMVFPYSSSSRVGHVFTGASENGGCMEGTFIKFSESAETGLFDVSLTRIYQDADASVEDEKFCISTITETVIAGYPVKSESEYKCLAPDTPEEPTF